jgi:hypothetical protein
MARKFTKIFMGSIRWFKYTNASAETNSITVNTQSSSLIYLHKARLVVQHDVSGQRLKTAVPSTALHEGMGEAC